MTSTSTTRITIARSVLIAGTAAGLTVSVGGACSVGVTPACMATCFEYTVARDVPAECKDSMAEDWPIPFTGDNGYLGRFCSNSQFNTDVAGTIIFLRDGGDLSELSANKLSNYLTWVDFVQDDLEADCIIAAPGQCVDEATVCSGIGADMYEALVTNETCVLEPGGEVEHELQGSEECHFAPVFWGFATDGEEYCTDGNDGADETTGEMSDPPFGDIDELVACNPQTECDHACPVNVIVKRSRSVT